MLKSTPIDLLIRANKKLLVKKLISLNNEYLPKYLNEYSKDQLINLIRVEEIKKLEKLRGGE
jgi:hypothetical protein